jgi:hypothetical protein
MKTKPTQAGKIDSRVPMLAAVLALALLGAGVSWRMSQKPSASVAAPVSTSSSVEQMAAEANRLIAEVQTSLAEDSQDIETDWPVVEAPKVVASSSPAAKQAEMSFRLRGFVRGGDRPAAFLNDKTLLVGEEIDGYTLTEIAQDHVTLKDPRGREHKLYPEAGP